MSGLVSFHTLHALYCYLELFHHHIPPVISCDNNPISSRRSLKFHLIKLNRKLEANTQTKAICSSAINAAVTHAGSDQGCGHLGDSLDFPGPDSDAYPMIAQGKKKKKKKCIAEWIKHRQTAGFRWMFTATVSSCCLSSCPLVTTSGPTVISWPALKHWYCELKAIETFTWVCMCTCTLERLIKNMSTQRGCPLQNSADNKVAASHDNVKWNPAGHVYPSNLR